MLSLTGSPTDTANITKKDVSGSFTVPSSKVYDRSTSASISTTSLNGLVSGEESLVTLSAISASYSDWNVGTGKTVTLNTPSLSGTETDKGNYNLVSTTITTTAIITAKPLTVNSASVTTKVYDSTDSATVAGATLSGIISGDVVTIGSGTSGSFNSEHVGTGKNVTTNMTLSGDDASNYSITQPTLSGEITKKAVTISGSFTVTTKVYDGTTDASIATNSLTVPGFIDGDNVTLSAIVAFPDRHAGTGKVVSLLNTTSLTSIPDSFGATSYVGDSDSDAENYSLSMTDSPTAAGIITAAPFTITAIDIAKYYNRATPETFGITYAAVAYSDDITTAALSYSSNAVNATRAGIYTITPSNVTSPTHNYTISYADGTLTISPKALTVTGAVVTSKVYDGTTAAAITGATLSGIVSGDTVTLSNASISSFASKDVGTGIAVTSSAMTIEGIDAANYSLTYPILTGNITSASSGGGGLGGGGGGGAVVVEPPVVTPPAVAAKLKLEFNIGINNSYLTTGTTVKAIQVMDIAPVIVESRTLLPIRFVVEPLGGTISWNEPEQKVTIIRGTTTIELWIGNNMATINGVLVMIDPNNANVKPFIIDPPGRTMLPLRFISEALGCTVLWDEPTQTVTITEL